MNKEGGNILHLVQFNAVKVNGGTAPFSSSTTPENTHLLGYDLAFCCTLSRTRVIVPSVGFHLVPFLIRKTEDQATCIQSSLKTLK